MNNFTSDVSALLRARNPLLWIVSREEARVENFVFEGAAEAKYVPYVWDCVNGVCDFNGATKIEGTADPAAALNALRNSRERQVWIMRDLPAWFRDPTVVRAVRSLARTLPLAPRNEARAIIILTPLNEVPPELAGHAIVLDCPLPDRGEVATILDNAVKALPEEMQAQAVGDKRDASIDAALGLSAEEIQSCYAKSLVSTRQINPAEVVREKKRVITREKVLEMFDPLPEGLDAIGGNEGLKSWLLARRAAFGPRARAYGLPAPKGVLLVGVPGCGKSLTAKAIATAWQMPLLRLDMGALKSKWVGESEGNIRKALKIAETVAPCVLWLDEIEKALAGATQGAADGGVSGDALGAVLSWMQDRAGSVFVVATANDVSALPPELLRKGRFDDIFFVDLPSETERAEILRAALRAHKRDAALVESQEVVRVTAGFTGAEIAALVPEAMYAAFADRERAITTQDVITAAAQVVPLSKTAVEKITAIRAWAKGRARPASKAEDGSGAKPVRSLDVG